MRYFTYIAEQQFKSDDQGNRLFLMAGLFARPYIIPDQATEQRLFWKMTWFYRIMLPAVILSMPILNHFYFFQQPWLFPLYLLLMVAVQIVVMRVLVHPELKTMTRAPMMPRQSFYRQIAEKHSERYLKFGFWVSLMFAVTGALVCFTGPGQYAVGLPCALIFSFMSVGWYKALRVKQGGEMPAA